MNRVILCILASLAFGGAVQAAAPAFNIEGMYERVTPPQPTSDPNRVEVVEVFWYGCPHCNRFQPYMHRWLARKPDYVKFVRMPAIFRKSWEIHARAYYISQALGTLDKTHSQMFDAIHKQKRRLNTRSSLRKFFVDQGIDGDGFDKTYASFGVESKLRQSRIMQERYGIRGVPSVIVNGKYRLSGSLAGSYENVLKVLDVLVDKEHKSLQSK